MIQKPDQQKPVKGLEKVFRNMCVVLFLILVFCVPGFLKFRQHCVNKGYGVVDEEAFIWVFIGFTVVFVLMN